MLKKLLKYDLLAILKYWWIVAVSSVGLSAVGALSDKIYYSLSQKESLNPFEMIIRILTAMGSALPGICITVLFVSAQIFIFLRLYKNLFSDEGYLTFTLPVKRRDILSSKIISALIVNALTLAVALIDILILLLISDYKEVFDFFTSNIIGIIFENTEISHLMLLVFALEILLLTVCLAIASYLLITICITFAANIAKRHKILAAIGIYYAVNGVLSFIGPILILLMSLSFVWILPELIAGAAVYVAALILLTILIFSGAVTYSLYTLELFFLEKKINLC